MAPKRWVRQAGALQNGRALLELRLSRSLTKDEAAAMIGCHVKALHHIEQETRGASEARLFRIAAAYGVNPLEITRREAAGAVA